MKTRRNKIINSLMKQWEILKENDVENLMKSGNIEQIEEIMQDALLSEKLDFESIKMYCRMQFLNLKREEIPKEYLYEIALYLNYSDLEDVEFFYEWKQFTCLLQEKEETLSENIAFLMEKNNLSSYSIDELLGV